MSYGYVIKYWTDGLPPVIVVRTKMYPSWIETELKRDYGDWIKRGKIGRKQKVYDIFEKGTYNWCVVEIFNDTKWTSVQRRQKWVLYLSRIQDLSHTKG